MPASGIGREPSGGLCLAGDKCRGYQAVPPAAASRRRGDFPIQSFDFLGYTFRPRLAVWHGSQCCVSFLPAGRNMALSRTSLSQMTPAPVTLESQNAMNAVDGATTERRIRINRPDEGRERCKGSRASGPRKDFSQCMPQPTTHSTSNVI
jgi:hypothetical protein